MDSSPYPLRPLTPSVTRPGSDGLLDAALVLLARLTDANLESLQIAMRLMRAQEAADAHNVRADLAVDRAVVSRGDADAVDAAMTAVRQAEAASEAEQKLTYSWAVHRCEVARLTQAARTLIDSEPASIRAYSRS